MASRQLIFLALLLLVLLPHNADGISRRLPSCEEAPDDPDCEDSSDPYGGGGYMDDPTEIPTDSPTISPTNSPTNSPTTSPTVTPCPAGSYFDRTMCKPCSTLGVGYYRSLKDPQDTCQLCESGFTSNAQTDGCDSCSVGKYGLRTEPGVCRSCPTNSTSVSQVADDDNEGCDCYSGYRNELGVDDVPDSYGVFNLICKPCPPGRYGADCADMCNNGHSTSTSEISTSETSCEACAVGSYSEQELVEWISGYTMKCKQCEIYKAHTTTDGKGKHYWGEGAHPCGCEPGYSYNADGECIECSSNSYQSLIGQALCQPCPAASTSSTGASRCTCDAVGHHMSITIDVLGEVALCEPCSPGSFYDSATESCVSCGAGTFTDASASTSCTYCDPDTWSNPGSSACEPCPEGSSTNGLSGQRFEGCLCSSGHGIDLTLKPPVCSQCTVGTYSSAAMQLCEACPLGHAVNLHGASACDECEAGKSQSLTGQTHCADCGLEKFSEKAGSFVCDSCPDDSTWPGSALLTSSSMYDCACSDGKEITPPDLSSPSPSPGVGPSIDLGGGSTESPSSGYTCTACPAGKSKSGGNNTCVSCAEGKFADSQGLSTCSICDENSYATGQGNLACTTCPEGSSANTYPATSVYQCVCGDGQEIKSLAGSATYQCGSCPAGKYGNSKSAQLEIGCATCPENEIAPNPGSHTCSPCTSPLVHNANYTKCVLARPEDVVPFANISLGDQATEHSVKMYFKDFTHVGLLWCKATDLGDQFSFAQYDGLPYLEQRGEYDPHSSSAITNRSHAHIKEYGQVTHIETTADTPTITFAGLASFSTFDISCFLEYLDSSSGTDIYKNSKVAYGGRVSTLPGYPLVLHDSCNQNTSNTAATLNFAAIPVAGTAYFYALEASSTYDPYADYVNGSIAFPTASEIRANGVSKFVEPITPTWGVSFPDEVEQTGPLSYCVYPHRDGVVSETGGEGGKDGSGYALLNYEAYYQVTISDLKPLTTYHILFWSEDDQEPRDFHPEVFEIYYEGEGDNLEYTPLFPTIQTGCCGFISLAQGFGSSLLAAVTSSLLTFELSQHPTQSVQVMALAYYFIHDSNTPCSPEGFQAKLSEGEGVGYLDVTSTALSSRVFSFTSNKDTSLEASFTATFQEAGCGIVVFQYVGSSVDEYGASSKGRGDDDMPTIDAGGDFSFTKSDETIATFVIESAGAPPAAPALSSVIFSQNGDKLIVDFVEATDIGSTTFNLTTLYSEFDCNSVLTIQGTDEGATCQFISNTCLQVTLPSTSSTVPGSDIAVNANKIYAVCMAGVDCSSSTNAEPLLTTIGLPESPLTPVVTVSGPLSISRCGDIRLDASTSFGNGGRDWLSFSWSFSASASDTSGVTSVVDAANSADAFDPVLTIPNANLRQGQQYSFQLTLTNFLSQTSSLTNYFVVSVADNSVPTVTIEGDLYRYISRSEEIRLFASGEAASCGDELKIIPAAQYQWSNSYGLEQTSADLRYFKVPAFTLTPGQVYTFTVLVTDSDALTNTASIQVEVEGGDLVAKITGGGRSVGATSSVTLSGASSFDTDYPERRGTADGFAYSWTCLESSPSYGAACTGLSDSSGESLSLDSTALNDLLGSTLDTITLLFTLQFTTTDSADTRYSELSTFITIERVDPPEVSITPIYVVKVNPSKKLQIKGSIETDSTNAVAAFWECEQIEYLDELSASPISLVVPASSIATTVPFNLILPSGSLAGATYDFRLVAGFDGVSASPQGQAQISIVVNSPPSAGSVSVSNKDGGNTGTALQTEFSIRAQNWVDDASDLPFTYSLFYRVTGATDETQITVDSASAIKDAVLLPVGGGNASSVVVTAKVADKYGSFGEASALAVVKAPQLTLEDMGTLTEQLTEDALAEGDTELVFQVLESSTSILNSVNCSLAPDCAGLNRLECEVGETSHACGKCLSGFVVENSGKGTSLPGNSQCKIKSTSCENGVVDGDETDIDCGGSCGPCGVGKACSLDADCYFEVCGDADICVAPQKNCVDNCNQRGSCVAKDYNGKAMAAQSCTEDVICRVSCSCDDGYFGDGCEKDAGEQQEVVKQRRNMLKTLKNVTKLQDVSSEAINQQASSIKSLVERVDELDDDSKELAVSLVEDIAAGAKSAVEGGGSLEQSTANYIGETVSSLMQVSSDDETSDQAELISNAIDSLAEAQITSLFVGEEPLVVVTENLKVSSEKLTLANMPGKSFATPTSEENEAKGIKPPELTMPQSGLDGYFDDDCNVGVSVAELGNLARSDNSSLDTTVMRLGLGCYKVAGSSRRRATSWWQAGEKGAQRRNLMTDSSVIVVLQNTDGGGGGASGEDGENGVVLGVGGENFVDCEWDEYKSMTCPGNSSSFPVCSGIKGNTTITCPDSSAPSCGISTGTDTSWNSSSCVVISSSSDNVTCSCDVLGRLSGGDASSSTSRRLNTIYDDQQSSEVGSTENIDFAGLFTGIVGQFFNTWRGASALSWQMVEQNIVVFATISVLLVGAFLMCVRGKIRDKYDEIRDKNQKEIEFLSRGMTEEDKYEYILSKSTPIFVQYMDNLWMNIKTQIGRRHDLSSTVFYYSPIKSRPQRVALLISTLLGMMFAESVLFDLAYPDYDPVCASLQTSEACLEPKSLLNTENDKCSWVRESQQCMFLEPEASLVSTMGIAIMACIVTSPLGVILVLIFNETIFPPTSGSMRAEARAMKFEREFKKKERGGAVADLTWDAFGDEEGSKFEMQDVDLSRDNSHKQVISDDEYLKRVQHQRVGGIGSDLEEDEEVKQMRADMEVTGCKKLVRDFCCCWTCCKKTTFDLRVEAEVSKALLAVKSRRKELEETVDRLKARAKQGDVSATVPLESAEVRLKVFREDWHLNEEKGGCGRRGYKTSLRYKVKHKVREDLRLADAIEKEFEDLETDVKEVRLLEYARMMKLSKIERKIYFQNRLIFENELPPVQRLKKFVGWIVIVSYCLGCGLYICLFGARVGATTCNTWLISFTLATLQDMFLYVPLKIMFMNVYLPGLISKRLKSIADPSDAENFQFTAFMPENASVYVAMNHPELDASNLVLSRGRAAQDDVEAHYDARHEAAMSPKSRRQGLKGFKMNTGIAVTKVKALRMYTSKGLSKFGLFFFAAFVLLPEFVQVSILDVVIPTAIGSFVYGNYQLYKLREWSPFTLDLVLILLIGGTVWWIRQRRHRHKLRKDHKEHVKKFRNSVVLELASVQLQSKPGQSIKKGNIKEERRRLSVQTEKEKKSLSDFSFPPTPKSPEEGGNVASPIHAKGRKKFAKGGQGLFAMVPLNSPGSRQVQL